MRCRSLLIMRIWGVCPPRLVDFFDFVPMHPCIMSHGCFIHMHVLYPILHHLLPHSIKFRCDRNGHHEIVLASLAEYLLAYVRTSWSFQPCTLMHPYEMHGIHRHACLTCITLILTHNPMWSHVIPCLLKVRAISHPDD